MTEKTGVIGGLDQIVSEMTYNESSGTLNANIPLEFSL